MKQLIMAAVFAVSSVAFAQGFKGESEASMTQVDAAKRTDTISAKTKNIWTLTDVSSLTGFGGYIYSKTDGEKGADALNLGVRYDHSFITDVFGAFVQAQYDKDPINGIFDNKYTYDLGVKYVFFKNDTTNWFGELGYRQTQSDFEDVDFEDEQYARAYTEVSHKFNESVEGKFWFEYLPALNDDTKDRWNTEASVSVAMTSILSLKTAYLVQYHQDRQIESSAGVFDDKEIFTTWLTALVAKY